MALIPFYFILLTLYEEETSGLQKDIFPPEGYLNTETGLHGAAQVIHLSLQIEDGFYIRTDTMEFQFKTTITQKWKDHRLKRSNHHTVILNKELKIWVPDLYCHTCIETPLQLEHQKFSSVLVTEEGEVSYSQTVLMTVNCLFQFRDFPFDVQRCKIPLSSYSYNSSYVQYKWISCLFYQDNELEEYVVHKKIEITEKTVKHITGSYSVLTAELVFIHQAGFYIFRLYIPSFIIVCLSWMVFSISPTEVGNRLTISITLMLSLLVLLGYVDSVVPKVSYIKASDWYLIVALLFVIASVIESLAVYVYLRRKLRKQMHEEWQNKKVTDQHKSKFSTDRKKSVRRDDSNMLEERIRLFDSPRNSFLSIDQMEPEQKEIRTKLFSESYINFGLVAKIELSIKCMFVFSFALFNVLYGHKYMPRIHS